MLAQPVDDCWDELAKLPLALICTQPIEFTDAVGFWPSILQDSSEDLQLSFEFALGSYFVRQESQSIEWVPSIFSDPDRLAQFLHPTQRAVLEHLYSPQLYLPGFGPTITGLPAGRRAGKTFNFALLYGGRGLSLDWGRPRNPSP